MVDRLVYKANISMLFITVLIQLKVEKQQHLSLHVLQVILRAEENKICQWFFLKEWALAHNAYASRTSSMICVYEVTYPRILKWSSFPNILFGLR